MNPPPYDPNNPNWNNQQPNQGYNPNQPPFQYGNNPNQPYQQGYNPQQPFQQGYNPNQPYQPYIPPFNPAIHSMQIDLPNSGLAYGLGIAGVMVFLHVLALICAIIALVVASSAISEYERNPGRYSSASYEKVKTARTLGIIGISLVALLIVIFIVVAALN